MSARRFRIRLSPSALRSSLLIMCGSRHEARRPCRNLFLLVKAVGVPVQRVGQMPRRTESGKRVLGKTGKTADLLQRRRIPSRHVVPSEQHVSALRQARMALRHRGIEILGGVEYPAVDPVANDQVEEFAWEMPAKLLQRSNDVLRCSKPAEGCVGIDGPIVVSCIVSALIVGSIGVAPDKQDGPDAGIAAIVLEYNLCEDSAILGKHGSGHFQRVAHKPVHTAADYAVSVAALGEQTQDLVPSAGARGLCRMRPNGRVARRWVSITHLPSPISVPRLLSGRTSSCRLA